MDEFACLDAKLPQRSEDPPIRLQTPNRTSTLMAKNPSQEAPWRASQPKPTCGRP